MTRRSRRRPRNDRRTRALLIIALAMTVLLPLLCVAGAITLWHAVSSTTRTAEGANAARVDIAPGTLVVAVSPEKANFFQELVSQFNEQRLLATTGDRMRVETVVMDPEAMIDAALRQARGDYRGQPIHAIHPDSSLWLDQLDRSYEAALGNAVTDAFSIGLVGESFRYAVSPIVIAAWESVARELGWPDQPVGWQEIQRKAQSDSTFKWNHASTSHASGLLATLAEFYAGAGKTRDLTEVDVRSPSTLEYVKAIEGTIRYYGEGETVIVQRAAEEGRSFLDAFVIQEQMLIQFNQAAPPERLIALYPREGTLWADHPLALLEKPEPTAARRQTFRALQEFLLSDAVQQRVLSAGYRPADLTIPLTAAGSPFVAENGVDPTQPQTTLQIPGPAVVEVVRNVWWYTKRHTNVFLVVDTSGSMSGEKIEAVRDALTLFVDQIKGDQERVGLIDFSTQINNIVPLTELGQNREAIYERIAKLDADGSTALLDATYAAYARLRKLNDSERINAIVVMTDGRENASSIDLDELVQEIERGNEQGPPIVIFAIAFGKDADYEVLEAIARASGGQVREGDLETIRTLYKVLSSYF
ncbi:MAG: VWA domain-containing protein [Anaerolineae bacterium]